MTLHWWMHWFWITRAAVITALLVVSVTIAAPVFEPYALALQEEQTESQDASLWSTEHVSAEDMWKLFHFPTTSSTTSLELWPSDPPELEDVSVSTYLPVETDTTNEVFTADQIVPVQKSSTLIPKVDSEKLNLSEEVKKSINNEDSSVVIALKDVYSVKHFSPISIENTSSSESETSLDAVVNSNSQAVDKPIVNVPRLITRDLKNSSEISHNLASTVASHNPLPSPLPQTFPSTVRTGKAAGYFSQAFHLHPLFISTTLPSESSSFPPNDFQQGPKIIIDDVNAGFTGDITINDRGEIDSSEIDSRTVWIKPYDKIDLKKAVLKSEVGHDGSSLDDAEMGDGPYSPPESSTVISPKTRNLGEPPVPSDDFLLPTDRPRQSPTTGKVIVKVTPPLLSTSKAVNITTESGKTSNNATRSGFLPPVVLNPEGNLSLTVDHNITHDKNSTADDSRTVEGKNSTNATHASEDEMAVLPTVVPVSNRVQAPAPPGSDHGLDAASITGISLGILVFAALIGAVSFVLYRRRFLNKPQTLNDKCSNPDSSGYIDDSTLRENSEEMYSLDNDSFLNSLEAMTIQNYWTDNVKHTKL